MSNNADLSNLNNDYLRRTCRPASSLSLERSQDYFYNCLVFRVKLYILRRRLLSFIERKFNCFIKKHRLRNARKLKIRAKLRENVRTDFDKLVKDDEIVVALQNKAKQRQRLISKLQKKNIPTNWQSFASCYTGNFFVKKGAYLFNVETDS